MSGVALAAIRSASRTTGALDSAASRTSSTMRWYWLSRAEAVAPIVSAPAPQQQSTKRPRPTTSRKDFPFVDERGTADRATQASYFPALREGSQPGERTGDPVAISEDPFVIAEDVVVTANFSPPEGRVGTSTYTLVVEDGELKVQEHRWTGDPLEGPALHDNGY